MKRTPQWVLVFKLCFSVLIFDLGNSRLLVSPQINELPHRMLAQDDSGYISIDCGVDEDYIDSSTISYHSDTSFVSTGENHIIPSDHSFEGSYFGRQLDSFRSFPDGKRNCYTLKPKQGKNNNYHLTALFAYRNYDREFPVFDVYLGVNYLETVKIDDNDDYYPIDVIFADDDCYLIDVIFVATTDTVDVCLVKRDNGIPFISLLELRFLKDPIYLTESGSINPVVLVARVNLGMFEHAGHFVRYMDEIYSRVWRADGEIWSGILFNTSAAFNTKGMNDAYKLPIEVLSTAVRAFDLSSSLQIVETNCNKSYEYVVYLHSFEFEESAQKEKKRTMNIAFNGESILTEPLTLHYWQPKTIYHKIKFNDDDSLGDINISITSTLESTLPAMLTAYEVYRLVPQPNPTTARGDVDAMGDIKLTYEIPRISWQGDPCVPKTLAWEGLSCSSDDNPRVTSLNLSSSNSRGVIAPSFSNLTKLEALDLSNNELTGDLPEFLAELPNLHVLNLARNQLIGSLPKVLKEKSNSTLMFSLNGNPGLCPTDSCTSKKRKSVVPLAAVVAGALAFLMIIVIFFFLMIRRFRREKQDSQEVVYITKRANTVYSKSEEGTENKDANTRGKYLFSILATVATSTTPRKDELLKSKRWTFSYDEILSITDNLKPVIGKGGFGYVYIGSLQDSRQVAALLLMVVHLSNLVPLVGYCNEDHIRALVYEYLVMGNLQQQLSGLDYLHNGCKPPILHRDLKSSNILLNEDLQAKISDFGLSRAFAKDIDTHVSTHPAGTLGYLDPEFHSSGNLNKKSDVYSFGIILLELVTGQPAIKGTPPGNINHILSWVIPKLETGDINSIMDPRLQGKFNIASAWKFVEIAISCTPPIAIQRPDIAYIASELKDCLALEIAPERTESNKRKSSYSQDMCILQLESESSPFAR